MVESIPGRNILLSEDEAAQVRRDYTLFNRLDPVRLEDGRFILGMQVLEEPAFAAQIPFLATRTTCRLVRDNGVVKVRFNSEQAGDPKILDRNYTPKDTQKPHDDPPPPTVGDWSADRLYESIGRALSRWEAFEFEFANLFSGLVGPSLDYRPAYRAYGSVLAFSGRSSMVKAAADAYFLARPYPRLRGAFDKIYAAADKLSKLRNKIAHGIVGAYTSPAGHVRGVALMPPEYATRGRKMAPDLKVGSLPAYAFTSGEVNYFAGEFDRLRMTTGRLGGLVFRYLEVPDS